MNLSEFDPAGFGFDLNTRELAALIWLGVIGSGLLLWKRTRLGGLSVIRMFFAWPLQRVFLAMTAYTILIVTLLAKLNAWEWSNLKTTVLWWLTVGFASLWEAQRIGEEKHPVRRLLLDALSLTAAITFIAEFGSFPLWAELILPVPLTFIALIVAMAPTLKGGEILVKPLLWILAIAGLGYLAWGTREILAAPFTFLSWNTLREFAAPIILSIAFIPFLFALAVLMTHETIFTSLKIMWKRPDLAAYAQRRALWAFGYDLDGMKRLG
ncbi:MAG TPA: hypothetical protein DCX75_10975, partial [Brevundimonas sp.]|nr:hypothetical protein [Brevundimonas sp.]